MTAIVSLLVVIFISMLITRLATIALAATGLSRESARFQARSALTGSGFTTSESEQVVRHPVRRRIVMMLMLIGSAGIAAVIGSLVLAFVQPEAEGGAGWMRLVVLVGGLIGLLALANSKWVDRWVTRATLWALKRYTRIDTRDYASLLHIGGDYLVTELAVTDDSWLADKTLADLKLRQEGVILLGIQRPDGTYEGVPTPSTVVARRDTLILYSRAGTLADLDARRRGVAGDEAHQQSVRESRRESREQREGNTGD